MTIGPDTSGRSRPVTILGMTESISRMEGDTLLASNDICNSAYNTRKAVTAIRQRLQALCGGGTDNIEALERSIAGLQDELGQLRGEVSGQIDRLSTLIVQIDEAERLLITACRSVAAIA